VCSVKGIWTVFKTIFKWSPLGLFLRGMGAGARFISNVFKSPARVIKGIWTGFKTLFKWSPLGFLARGIGAGGLDRL